MILTDQHLVLEARASLWRGGQLARQLSQGHHRSVHTFSFYGESVPGDDFSVDNLHYLTSRQALADAAALIDHVNRTYHCRKWMAFGGSYSGALSAWFRTKYPHIIDGALSR